MIGARVEVAGDNSGQWVVCEILPAPGKTWRLVRWNSHVMLGSSAYESDLTVVHEAPTYLPGDEVFFGYGKGIVTRDLGDDVELSAYRKMFLAVGDDHAWTGLRIVNKGIVVAFQHPVYVFLAEASEFVNWPPPKPKHHQATRRAVRCR